MTVKILKANLLVINYEFLNDVGMNTKRKQSFGFLPLQASDDNIYAMGKTIGDCLKTAPKSIEQNTTYTLTEG